MNNILHYINIIVSHIPWAAVAASGVISPLLMMIKKWLDIKSEKVLISLVGLMSAGAVMANYLLHVPTSDPSIIAIQTAVVGFMTQPIYYFIVKPGFAWIGETVAAAAAFKKEVKSAAVPTTDASVQVAPPVVDNFTH